VCTPWPLSGHHPAGCSARSSLIVIGRPLGGGFLPAGALQKLLIGGPLNDRREVCLDTDVERQFVVKRANLQQSASERVKRSRLASESGQRQASPAGALDRNSAGRVQTVVRPLTHHFGPRRFRIGSHFSRQAPYVADPPMNSVSLGEGVRMTVRTAGFGST
jgi:hypothetical protein